MIKKIIKWSIIVVAVVIFLCAIICSIKYMRGRWIPASQVEKVEFRGFTSCEVPIPEAVELNESEVRKVVRYFNTASYRGRVDAEGCDSDFNFTIYLEDGTRIYFREAGSPRLEVNPPEGEKFWITSQALAEYAQELIKKYGLTENTSSHEMQRVD